MVVPLVAPARDVDLENPYYTNRPYRVSRLAAPTGARVTDLDAKGVPSAARDLRLSRSMHIAGAGLFANLRVFASSAGQ